MMIFIELRLQEENVLKSLLSGHEVQLEEGAFGNLSQRILRLFTEAKRTHSEQMEDLENIPIVSVRGKLKFRNNVLNSFAFSNYY